MKAIVVEDVKVARDGLVNMLREYELVEVAGQAGNVQDALRLIDQHEPELLFLDIQLPGESAFDLLAKLDYRPKLVFTTAYSDYALKAFDFYTVDYLLKPISRERLTAAIAKLELESSDDNTLNSNEQLGVDSKVFIRDADQNHMVALGDIFLFESCKNHTRVYFANQKPFVHRALSHIEERLPKSHFFRINRNQIVNLQQISEVIGSHSSSYELIMSPSLRLNVSRRQSVALKDLLSL